MPITEKEYNGYLFDQLTFQEDIESVAKQTNATEVLDEKAIKRRQIERKLYQLPDFSVLSIINPCCLKLPFLFAKI